MSNKNTHLTLDDRKIIKKCILKAFSKNAIARTLDKDATTVAKEIKKYRIFKLPRKPFECINYNTCTLCIGVCNDFVDSGCSRRDYSPGVCSGCSIRQSCHKSKYDYDPFSSHDQYLYTLSDSRQGINLLTSEFSKIANIVVPLLKKGQSPYHILNNHPELDFSLKSFYNYIEWGYFATYGITDINLKRKLKFKVKKSQKLKKRKDCRHYYGRTYKDFRAHLLINGISHYVEMDTVYNSPSGPYLQTFTFTQSGVFLAILHQNKTANSMIEGLRYFYNTLGCEKFLALFGVILTDRGTEFSDADGMEKLNTSDSTEQIHIFYCDPMQSCQKPRIEKAHTTLREILPKHRDLTFLTQAKLSLICSHINSMPRKSLGGKTPYEMFEFIHEDAILGLLNIEKIEKDQVCLIPSLV